MYSMVGWDVDNGGVPNPSMNLANNSVAISNAKPEIPVHFQNIFDPTVRICWLLKKHKVRRCGVDGTFY